MNLNATSTELIVLSDFPKLFCPFIRQTFQVDKEHFKQQGRKYGLRNPEVYLVVNRVNPGYEWVFEDDKHGYAEIEDQEKFD